MVSFNYMVPRTAGKKSPFLGWPFGEGISSEAPSQGVSLPTTPTTGLTQAWRHTSPTYPPRKRLSFPGGTFTMNR